MQKTRILLLGSTGSIGRQTLEVALREPEAFEIVGLAASQSEKELREQAEKCGVKEWILTHNDEAALVDFVQRVEADLVVVAVSGVAGLAPILAAIRVGRDVALANKEALVMAGAEVIEAARQKNAQIFPIDSEHSALYQLLKKVGRENVQKLILTCSGGPFWRKTLEELHHVTVGEALCHPTWAMGPKVTIDSATWVNKGFEIIEAHHLFGFDYDDIEVVVHPPSYVHGMVKLRDGTAWFHASPPDMRIPIHTALHRMRSVGCGHFETNVIAEKSVIPAKAGISSLFNEFYPPQNSPLYRGIEIALRAGRKGLTACNALVRADDEAVSNFLEGKIKFLEIYKWLEESFDCSSIARSSARSAMAKANITSRK